MHRVSEICAKYAHLPQSVIDAAKLAANNMVAEAANKNKSIAHSAISGTVKKLEKCVYDEFVQSQK